MSETNNFKCPRRMKYADCELAILRHVVDNQKTRTSKTRATSSEVIRMLKIVRAFIKRKRLICYGGVSINAILPKESQFYNYDVEVPDYDFYSSDALKDAKELADVFAKQGFQEIEAKSGVHHGTYKVFVNFIGIADITMIEKPIFNKLKKEALNIEGILYCPPNFLRMAMYLELSRPMGDISRWEKVLKRLTLLNKQYPLKEVSCFDVDFQRDMDNSDEKKIFHIAKNYLIDQGVVFFGSYAVLHYSQYMPDKLRKQVQKIPDFDVLSIHAEATATGLQKSLTENGIDDASVKEIAGMGEIISSHFQVMIKNQPIVYVYHPNACHSYNEIKDETGTKTIKVATIDTMMSFYLAFLYLPDKYYNKTRILCMAKFLFEVQQKNRLEQKGLLKRFSLDCYGKQTTLEEIRAEKSKKYKELKGQYGTKAYEEWFLRYRPNELKTNSSYKSYTRRKKK
jgi:Poly(A) polymerase catalytic subunit